MNKKLLLVSMLTASVLLTGSIGTINLKAGDRDVVAKKRNRKRKLTTEKRITKEEYKEEVKKINAMVADNTLSKEESERRIVALQKTVNISHTYWKADSLNRAYIDCQDDRKKKTDDKELSMKEAERTCFALYHKLKELRKMVDSKKITLDEATKRLLKFDRSLYAGVKSTKPRGPRSKRKR